MSDSTTPMKQCSKCGQVFPATTEYFPRQSQKKNGLRPQCKSCHNETNAQWRELNREKDREVKRISARKNPKRNERYYQENREWYLEYAREYSETNKEKRKAQGLVWKKKNPEKVRATYHRYIARKRSLPDNFTGEQWLACLEYFHYCCAVCGRQLRDLLGLIEPQADHWIALSNPDCPGTVVTNMVCLCNDCNVSKGGKPPMQWLIEKFGKTKAKQILERIETYFSSVSGA